MSTRRVAKLRAVIIPTTKWSITWNFRIQLTSMKMNDFKCCTSTVRKTSPVWLASANHSKQKSDVHRHALNRWIRWGRRTMTSLNRFHSRIGSVNNQHKLLLDSVFVGFVVRLRNTCAPPNFQNHPISGFGAVKWSQNAQEHGQYFLFLSKLLPKFVKLFLIYSKSANMYFRTKISGEK